MRGAVHSGSSRERRLPVFVSPEKLRFVGEDEASHKQILTLFNPYNFNIRFKVLSNTPHKYSVIESQGTINSHCCINLIVCHRLAAEGPYNVSDKLKIELFHDRHNSTRPVGWKLVISTLLKTRTGSQSFDECTERMHEFLSPAAAHSSAPLPHSDRISKSSSGSVLLLVLAAVVCLLVLLLPLPGEGGDQWPSYLHISGNQKLIAAFALGILTLAILKS